MDREEFVDRPRGILTKQQRRHLLGMLDEDPVEDDDKIRMRNYRIRQHIRESLIDFQLLASAYNSTIEEAIMPWGDGDKGGPLMGEDYALGRGIQSVFEVLYLALGSPNPAEGGTLFKTWFSTGVENALARMHAEQGQSVVPRWVRLAANIGEVVPLSEVKKAYERGERLYRLELRELYWAGEISYEELYEEMQTAHDDPSNMDEMIEEYAEEEEAPYLRTDPAETRRKQREEVAVEEISGSMGGSDDSASNE